MTRGIVLIALRHPYYLHMAFNLAVSIKYNAKKFGKEIPVAIIGDNLHMVDTSVFDHIIEFDRSLIERNGIQEPIKAKTLLYELTPFDQTVFLDADTIITPFKDFTELFSDELIIANRGEIKEGGGKSEWVDVKQLFEHYKIHHWYDLSSEFIAFGKSELNKKFFDDAKAFYDDESLPIITFKEKNKEGKKGILQFNGGKPDEVPFGLAVEKNSIRFQSPFLPSYWQPQYFYHTKTSDYIKKNYYIVSAGGAFVQENIKKIFKELNEGYFYNMGIKKVPYQLVAKSKIMSERKLI